MASGTPNTFGYDGDGKRVKKEDSSGTSKFVWDRENIVVETNASDVIQAVYSVEPAVYGSLISQYRSAATSFFHFDAIGSTSHLTNSLAIITDIYVHKAFGSPVVATGSTIAVFRFVGRSGYSFAPDLLTYYLRERYQDPVTGRFLAREHGLDVGGLSMYAYVGNRPTVLTDPSGLTTVAADWPHPPIHPLLPGLPTIDNRTCGAMGNDVWRSWFNMCHQLILGKDEKGGCVPQDKLGDCLVRFCLSGAFQIRIVCKRDCERTTTIKPPDIDVEALCGYVKREQFEYGEECEPVKPTGAKLDIVLCFNNLDLCGAFFERTLIHELVHLCSLPQGKQPHEISEACAIRCFPPPGKPRFPPEKCCCPKTI